METRGEQNEERTSSGERHPQHFLARGFPECHSGHDPDAHHSPPSVPTISRNRSSSEGRWGVTSYTSTPHATRYRTISGTTALANTESVNPSRFVRTDRLHRDRPFAISGVTLVDFTEIVIGSSLSSLICRVSTTSPSFIKATRSHVISTSPSRWEFSSTVAPRSR